MECSLSLSFFDLDNRLIHPTIYSPNHSSNQPPKRPTIHSPNNPPMHPPTRLLIHPPIHTTAAPGEEELVVRSSPPPWDLALHIGDIAYAFGHEHIWRQWFEAIEPIASSMPYMVGWDEDNVASIIAFGV